MRCSDTFPLRVHSWQLRRPEQGKEQFLHRVPLRRIAGLQLSQSLVDCRYPAFLIIFPKATVDAIYLRSQIGDKENLHLGEKPPEESLDKGAVKGAEEKSVILSPNRSILSPAQLKLG